MYVKGTDWTSFRAIDSRTHDADIERIKCRFKPLEAMRLFEA
jgi:hypothetical protein